MEFGCKKGKQCGTRVTPRSVIGLGRRVIGGTRISKVTKKEESPKKEEPSPNTEDNSAEVMKDLLEEANKMLKTISNPKPVEEAREGKLERLQRQLDELRAVKVFRVARMEVNEEEGLIDSGATHSLRGWRKGDRHRRLGDIQVTLGCGRKTSLKMTSGVTKVSEDQAPEPILPMRKLISVLWTKDGGLTIEHPSRGMIKTKMRGGCPYVEKSVALDFIDELECEGEGEFEEEEEAEEQGSRRIQVKSWARRR